MALLVILTGGFDGGRSSLVTGGAGLLTYGTHSLGCGPCATSSHTGHDVSAKESPVGCWGRIARGGAIRSGSVGEVMISIRGGVEAFYAKDADGGSIDALEEVVVVDYEPPRVVIVTRVAGR